MKAITKFNFSILFFFIGLLVLGIILKENFSNYNYIYIFCVFILQLFNYHLIKISLIKQQIGLLFCYVLVYLFRPMNFEYMILEFVNLLVVSNLLYYANYNSHNLEIKYRQKLLKLFYFISIIYICLYISVWFVLPNSFNTVNIDRYDGLMGSTNLGASLSCLLLIYILEYSKLVKRTTLLKLLIVIIVFIYIIYITKTRTLLLLLPYFLLQFYKKFKFKNILAYNIIFSFTSIIFVVIVGLLVNVEYVTSEFRINKEASYDTRDYVNLILTENIKESYFFIPNGFNSAYDFIQVNLGVEKFPVHNDFLKNWHDLGFIFIIVLFFIGSKLKPIFQYIDFKLIVIFIVTFALHNILFSVVVWIPIYFILLLFYFKKINENSRYTKKS